MNVEGRVLVCPQLSCVPSSNSNPSGLFPSSLDIPCSIFCGSLPQLLTTATERRIPYCHPLRDHSEITSVFLDFHRACPGWDHNWPATTQYGRSSPRLSFRLAERVGRKVWENRWSGLSVAGQLSPRWDKPSGSGMWQEVFRAENTEIVFPPVCRTYY